MRRLYPAVMTVTIDLTEHEARTLIYACELTRDVWSTGHVRIAAIDRATGAPSTEPLEVAHAKLLSAFERDSALQGAASVRRIRS